VPTNSASSGSGAIPRSVTIDPLRLQVVGDELARAGAEMDGRGKAEAMDHRRKSGNWAGGSWVEPRF
jgi:hypothetical protein